MEKLAGVDPERETPAYKLENGVDYVPMNKYKVFLIHFLNIAGLGPIFGTIQGALFGPAAFLWIVFGTIFAGAVHDFFSGFMSVRKDGLSMPSIVNEYMGDNVRKFLAILVVITGILVASVFATGAAELIGRLSGIDIRIWLIIIFLYFLIATLFPVDKIIGTIYPLFGIFFVFMAVSLFIALLLNPAFNIPELTASGLYFSEQPIFPFLFVTIACGAISGFHSSQAPIVARCIESEKDMRFVFFGAMVLEGIVALLWAAIAMAFFNGQPQIALLYGASPSIAVNEISTILLGPIGLIFAIIGVVVCPITTGDTALRSSRITIADELNISQDKFMSRFKIAFPLFVLSFALTFVDFSLIWRYFAWLQLISATIILFTATVYLMRKKKNYIVTLLPAIFCTLVSFGYILQASEGLHLPELPANIITIVLTALVTGAFIYYYKIRKNKDVTVE